MAKNSSASSTSSSPSVEFLLIEELDFVHVEEQGLSHWELVNACDADSEKGEQEEDEKEVEEDSIGNGVGSLGSEISSPICLMNDEMETHRVDPHHDDVDVKYDGGCYGYGYGYGYDYGGHVEEQDDDGDDRYDLDDELVPWSVSDKIGRQRMRKLGKRAFPKMYNSKRSPYLFVRPGCVRGKHGLGLKHNC